MGGMNSRSAMEVGMKAGLASSIGKEDPWYKIVGVNIRPGRECF